MAGPGGEPRLERGMERLDGGIEMLQRRVVIVLLLMLQLSEICRRLNKQQNEESVRDLPF